MKKFGIGLLIILGIGMLGLIFTGISSLLPSAAPQPAPAVASVQSTSPTQSAAVTKPQPEAMAGGLTPINYTLFTSTLTQLAHQLHMVALLPKTGYAGTLLGDTYIDNGILNMEYNNMIIMESPSPIESTYQPSSVTPVGLANGVAAQWDFIPGGGGPSYRLLFEEEGTYIRLQLYSPQVNNSLSSTETIANTFQSLR